MVALLLSCTCLPQTSQVLQSDIAKPFSSTCRLKVYSTTQAKAIQVSLQSQLFSLTSPVQVHPNMVCPIVHSSAGAIMARFNNAKDAI